LLLEIITVGVRHLATDESLHAKEHPMLKRPIMVLAGAVLAGGLAVTVAQARGGGGFGGGQVGGFAGARVAGMGSTFGGARIDGFAAPHMAGSPRFAAGFRTGCRYGDYRPGYGRAYRYLGCGYGYDFYDDGYDECEIDAAYARCWPRCY
jgi:hypothetical protein